MKLIFTLLLATLAFVAAAQPQKINYQAVALNSSGIPVKNKVISVQLSILDSSASGTMLYTETHQPSTDLYGQFSIFLGGGTAAVGTFANLPWGNNRDKFLKAEADIAGGINYVLMGISQIVSVPYALAAGNSNLISDQFGNSIQIKYDGNGNPFIALVRKTIRGCGQVVTYNGESYQTVQIDTQCWVAKNLNIGTMIDGSRDQRKNSIIEKYCFNNDSVNCNLYGGLYQWAEAVQYPNGATNTTSPNPAISGNVRGICPAGWHLPSYAEFCILTTFLDPTVNCGTLSWSGTDAGGKLKSTTALWNFPNTGATNSSGFSALPVGSFVGNNIFTSLGNDAYFLSSTEYTNRLGLSLRLLDNYDTIYKNQDPKSNGYSIRCIRD